MLHKIAFLRQDTDPVFRVTTLANLAHLPVIQADQITQFELILKFSADKLMLQLIDEDAPGPIYADFLAGKLAHRRLYGGGKNQLLAKAVGLHKFKSPRVVDVTAGLGQDSFILACLGCDVQMIERSPIIAALVADALQRAQQDGAFAHLQLQLIAADSIRFLKTLAETDYPDIIYLDPMFPSRSKSALVKKEMRVLRTVVGDDIDADALFQLAMRIARRRVVVKRSRYAPLLADLTPTLQYKGQSSRFDVYVIASKN